MQQSKDPNVVCFEGHSLQAALHCKSQSHDTDHPSQAGRNQLCFCPTLSPFLPGRTDNPCGSASGETGLESSDLSQQTVLKLYISWFVPLHTDRRTDVLEQPVNTLKQRQAFALSLYTK